MEESSLFRVNCSLAPDLMFLTFFQNCTRGHSGLNQGALELQRSALQFCYIPTSYGFNNISETCAAGSISGTVFVFRSRMFFRDPCGFIIVQNCIRVLPGSNYRLVGLQLIALSLSYIPFPTVSMTSFQTCTAGSNSGTPIVLRSRMFFRD